MPNTLNKEFPFRLGCDPEFNIMLKDNRIPADRILQILFNKESTSGQGYKIKNAGELGWDGHSATGEIRPSPAYSPQKLVENIGELFTAMTKKSKLLELSTNSDKAPIGGHLHFELPENLIGKDTKIKNIHKKMALFYIPIMIGEDLVNSRLRIKHGYGKLNDYATQQTRDGNNHTYEFRCPNAEWITTPKIAQATIAYLATVFNETINHPENMKRTKDIMIQNETQIQALQELALAKYVLITKSILSKIKKHIKTFEYYKTYKTEIDYIFTPQKILKDKEKVNFEITNGWKLVKNKTPIKRDLMNEKKMKTLAKKLSVDEITGAISAPYNPDDSRCIDFSKALKDRIIAYSWKLKHDYFIFGLRKDIKNYIIMNGRLEILNGKDIKNRSDLNVAEEIVNKMIMKYKTSTRKESMKKEEQENLILIGIPYEKRIDLKIKEFISIVHNIENDKEKITTEEELQKIERSTEIGTLSKVYNKSQPDINLMTDRSREDQRQNEQQADQIRENIATETESLEL
jgi:hypothetical protein